MIVAADGQATPTAVKAAVTAFVKRMDAGEAWDEALFEAALAARKKK